MEVVSASYAAETRPRPRSPMSYQQYQGSQDSITSRDSSTSSHERTHDSSSSNVSQATNVTEESEFRKPRRPAPLDTRVKTPEQTILSPTSPMSIVSPVSGAKRTASGHVKNASLSSLQPAFSPRRSRAESMSSTGSRAGELAASLKLKLGHAMARVQSWESRPFGDRRPMTAGLDSVISPPSKRRSGTFATLVPASDYTAASSSLPYLDPPVDIHSAKTYSPRTPMGFSRPVVMRTDTQTAEAEREALQALTQLGSPQNSQLPRQRMSQHNSSQGSPMRSEFASLQRVILPRGDDDPSSTSKSDGGRVSG